MPLDLSAISRHMDEFVAGARARHRPDLLAEAQDLLRGADPAALRGKLDARSRRFPWLVAYPPVTFGDSLAGAFRAPAAPADLSVAASDGSLIAPSRHQPYPYMVLNTSRITIRYGAKPWATLHSLADFRWQPDDLVVKVGGTERPLDETLLGIEMSIAELEALAETALAAPAPVVGLRDGSFILWKLQGADDATQARTIARFLAPLDRLRAEGVPAASYISMTNARDLCSALRVLLCQQEPSDCEHCTLPAPQKDLCEYLGRLRDRQLLSGMLTYGERTGLFASQSSIMDSYGPHEVRFCYLNVGGEIARIEMPCWAADDPGMCDLIQGAILDQCGRSADDPPYPPALAEAHEKAVISTTERQTVDYMVERALAAQGLAYTRSAKDSAKRRRGV